MAKEDVGLAGWDDEMLYGLAHRVLDVVFEYASSNKEDEHAPYLVDLRRTGEDYMFFRRRANGFILVCSKYKPCRMVTPWGTWYFAEQESKYDLRHQEGWQNVMPMLAGRLGLVKYLVRDWDAGVYYYVHEVDGVPCPGNHGGIVCSDSYVAVVGAAWRYWRDKEVSRADV